MANVNFMWPHWQSQVWYGCLYLQTLFYFTKNNFVTIFHRLGVPCNNDNRCNLCFLGGIYLWSFRSKTKPWDDEQFRWRAGTRSPQRCHCHWGWFITGAGTGILCTRVTAKVSLIFTFMGVLCSPEYLSLGFRRHGHYSRYMPMLWCYLPDVCGIPHT